MSQKQKEALYSREALNLVGADGSDTSLKLMADYGKVFIVHVNHSNFGDRDYQSYFELTIPEALVLYNLLEEFFEK